MTPGAISALRLWFQFDRYLEPGNPEELFEALMNVARWRVEQGNKIRRDLDEWLSKPMENNLARFGLLTHLATIDGAFFHLVRRMTARTLVRNSELDDFTRQLTAALLDPEDIPSSTKPQLARDVAIILALCVGKAAGWPPTQNREKAGDSVSSGTVRALTFLPMLGPAAIEKVWNDRAARLAQASFDQRAVSEFLGRVSRTT